MFLFLYFTYVRYLKCINQYFIDKFDVRLTNTNMTNVIISARMRIIERPRKQPSTIVQIRKVDETKFR